MKNLTFFDFLRIELRHGGLLKWAGERPYMEVIDKPEIILAHQRAWHRYRESRAHDA